MLNLGVLNQYKKSTGIEKPFKLFDLDLLEQNLSTFEGVWRNTFPNVDFYYSVKTCPISRILEAVHQHGWGAEAVSNYEFDWAASSGIPTVHIISNGLNKDRVLIDKLLIQHSIVFIESEYEFQNLIELLSHRFYSDVKVGFRAALPMDKNQNKFSDFGLPLESIIGKIETLKKYNVEAKHIGFHAGSSNKNASKYIEAINYIFPVVQHIFSSFDQCSLSIGGGFPSRHILKELKINPVTVWKSIAEDIRSELAGKGIDFEKFHLILEPGRAVVEDCGYLFASIVNRKQIRGREIDTLVLNVGMNEIPSIKRKYHELHFLRNDVAHPTICKIRGNLCFEEDIFFEQHSAPKTLLENEPVVVTGTGSYDTSTSYSWSHPTLPYVFVKDQETMAPEYAEQVNRLNYTTRSSSRQIGANQNIQIFHSYQ